MQETTITGNLRAKRRQFGFQEGGLVLVVLVLGAVLAFFGGSVERPKFRVNEQGDRERVFRELPNGEREAVLERKNKFLNADNLAQIAKDTSFVAVMAVGAPIV